MKWTEVVALFVIASLIAVLRVISDAPAAPPREPCVAFTFLPDVAGYEPARMQPTVVFVDAPIFDRLFAGCVDAERRAILAVLPGNVVRVMRREPR